MARTAAAALPALLGASLAACGAEPGPARPRNLILVTVDTLRADRLACFGARHATTDAAGAARRGSAAGFTIDELAAGGARFPRAYAPRGMTFPSIATLMTGRPPLEHGAPSNGDTLPEDARTLAERLQQAGFATAAFTTNKLLVPRSGIEQGFDSFFADGSPERDVHAVEAASDWIAARDLEGGPPLFVWIHLTGPHLPYDPAPLGEVDFARLFADPAYVGPADGSRAFLDRAHEEGRVLEGADLDHARALYDGEVARIDLLLSHLARFLSGADPAQPVDLLSRSLLVFAADHGEELGERNAYFGHAKSVHEEVLRVPLFVRGPGVAAREVDAIVELEDLLPTFLEVLGLEREGPIRGQSLAPALRGAELRTGPAFGIYGPEVVSVRDERWRLVLNPARVVPSDPPRGAYAIPERALYDLAADPEATRDVAAQHPEDAARLEQAARAWRARLDERTPDGGVPSEERMRALRELGYVGDE